MTVISHMVCPHGLSMARVGAPYGSGYPGEVFGTMGQAADGDRGGLGVIPTWQWICQFDRRSIRFFDRIVASIKDLGDRFRRIRDDKDFSRRTVSSSASARCDEVGELIANFDAMRSEIERHLAELTRRSNESPDHAVLARTEDLSAAHCESQTAKAAARRDLRQPMSATNPLKDTLSKTHSAAQDQFEIGIVLSRGKFGD